MAARLSRDDATRAPRAIPVCAGEFLGAAVGQVNDDEVLGPSTADRGMAVGGGGLDKRGVEVQC